MTDDNAYEDVLSEMVAEGERRLRVYDSKGDFIIVVPDGAKVTFGYFNPATQGDAKRDRNYDYSDRNVARQTALRIYEGKTAGSNQLACFLGVKGFRDDRIKLTRLVERVVVERHFAQDDEGEEWGGKRQRSITAAPEDGTFL